MNCECREKVLPYQSRRGRWDHSRLTVTFQPFSSGVIPPADHRFESIAHSNWFKSMMSWRSAADHRFESIAHSNWFNLKMIEMSLQLTCYNPTSLYYLPQFISAMKTFLETPLENQAKLSKPFLKSRKTSWNCHQFDWIFCCLSSLTIFEFKP